MPNRYQQRERRKRRQREQQAAGEAAERLRQQPRAQGVRPELAPKPPTANPRSYSGWAKVYRFQEARSSEVKPKQPDAEVIWRARRRMMEMCQILKS